MKKFNLFLVFVIGCIFAAFSQVPGAFNYQAVVRNASGDVITNANVSFRVSILQNSETGTSVYVETQNATTNAFGLVSLKIGQGTLVSGNFENVAWETSPHFIKVEVDPAGGSAYSLLGTSELLSVPYALQAENVSNKQTLSLSGNNLSISDGNTVTLPASGNSLWTASGDNIYRNSGFVGIGTATPSAPLEIKSNNGTDTPSLIIGSESTNDAARPGIKFLNNTSQYIAADDVSDEIFGFYSKWGNTRNYDAKLRVYGKAGGSWGKYIEVTHDGTDGKITTDTGALKLSPANSEVIINGEVIRSFTNTLIINPGNSNFFAGENAGNLTVTGPSNTACGSSALHSNTTGQDNTAFGRMALYKNTTGTSNTASGSFALFNNTTGNSNTANGHRALFNNTTGNENTASGRSALLNNTIGNNNTATGRTALFSNTTGGNNTATGMQALYKNTTGSYNTASGKDALLENTTGTSNTASGSFALFNNTTGNSNTANGYGALVSNTTGNENTASGREALSNNTIGNNNTATGRTALFSNTTGVNNTATGMQALYKNTTGSYNTASGKDALFENTTGSHNTVSGVYAGDTNTEGNNNTFIGAHSDAGVNNLTNATAIGYGAVVSASNQMYFGNNDVTWIGGHASWSSTSDKRKKKDISNIPLGLDFINALRPVQFRMREGNDRLDFGFIAQDIEALLGVDYNILGIGGDPERTLSLRYTDFIAPMVKAMQEQQSQIMEQQEIIDALKSENGQLKASNMEIISRLEKLENLMSVSAQK